MTINVENLVSLFQFMHIHGLKLSCIEIGEKFLKLFQVRIIKFPLLLFGEFHAICIRMNEIKEGVCFSI